MSEDLVVTDPAVLETLYDPLRYRLFRLLEGPRSVPELAEEVTLPANRLYYHVRRLVQSGLIEQVPATGTGRVYRARRLRFSGDMRLPNRRGPLQAIIAELSRGEFAGDSPRLVSWHVGPLTRARARELERRMQALIGEFTKDESGDRYGILAVLTKLRGASE
jgi:DNA-binding transcriptional ArsR family regulator